MRILTLILTTALALPAAAQPLETGEELYKDYCVLCHGPDGAGDGQYMEFENIDLPDLRTLKQRNGGEFPLERVIETIDGRRELNAHGDRFMPAWGEIFRFDEENGDAVAHGRILNLLLYLSDIQE